MITRFLWWLLPYLTGQKLKHKNFDSFAGKIKNVFLIMPENEPDVKGSQILIDSLITKGNSVTVLINGERLALLKNSYSYKAIEYFNTDRSKLGFPKTNLKGLLRKVRTDLVINLHREPDIFSVYCAGLILCEYKAAFALQTNGIFFNLQFKANNQNPQESYKNFLNCLYMFL